MSALHGIGPKGSLFDRLDIEARLGELGLEGVRRHAFGPGGTVAAAVGRRRS